jgi:hypothetical protein
MRLHAIFCVLQLLIVIGAIVLAIWGYEYFSNHFGFVTSRRIYAWGNIPYNLSYGLLYGYMGYLMTTLSAPQDPGNSQNVLKLL